MDGVLKMRAPSAEITKEVYEMADTFNYSIDIEKFDAMVKAMAQELYDDGFFTDQIKKILLIRVSEKFDEWEEHGQWD